MPKLLIDVLNKKSVQRKPVWLMRQAGRYLPDYQATRKQAGSFLDLCLDPKLAAEVTLQPIRHFGMDAAIIFADILLVPYAMRMQLEFREGEGPIMPPVRDLAALKNLHFDLAHLAAVGESLKLVKKSLPDTTVLIGFAGSPWTVACYMLQGHGKTGFPEALRLATAEPALMQDLFDLLHQATLDYLLYQIASGAEVIQLFDSWAALLTDDGLFERYVIQPTQRLITALKEKHPTLPIIGFPRGSHFTQYQKFATITGLSALSLDQDVTLLEAAALQKILPIQGNLDPDLLVKGGTDLTQGIDQLLTQLGAAHIINLGHGVVPQTPPEHVRMMVERVKKFCY